jgi:hypothetical protein
VGAYRFAVSMSRRYGAQDEMNYRIRQMRIADYPKVYALWRRTEGLSLEGSDSRAAIGLYLRRNRGLCFVACNVDRWSGAAPRLVRVRRRPVSV